MNVLNSFSVWLSDLDWSTFLPSLLSGLVAASVGVVGVRYGFRLQQSNMEETRLDDALSRVIAAIPDRVSELDDYARALYNLEEYISEGGNPDTDAPAEPEPFVLGVRIEAARMLAKGDQIMVVASMADAFHALPTLPPTAQRARLIHLLEMIRKWRSAEWSPTRAIAEFKAFSETALSGTGLTLPPPWRTE